jgi:NADPH:quinone reductase-like Zn-dependent oxidoreductase
MEAYHIDRFGSVDGVVSRSSADPQPGPKEVLMRVRATSLNYRDLMVLKGGGRGPTKVGVIPLSDGADDVAAIGEGVTRVKIGDRIAGCFHPRWFGGPIKPGYLTDRLGANLDGIRGIRGRGGPARCAAPRVQLSSRPFTRRVLS